jgi:hypothetical protein
MISKGLPFDLLPIALSFSTSDGSFETVFCALGVPKTKEVNVHAILLYLTTPQF